MYARIWAICRNKGKAFHSPAAALLVLLPQLPSAAALPPCSAAAAEQATQLAFCPRSRNLTATFSPVRRFWNSLVTPAAQRSTHSTLGSFANRTPARRAGRHLGRPVFCPSQTPFRAAPLVSAHTRGLPTLPLCNRLLSWQACLDPSCAPNRQAPLIPSPACVRTICASGDVPDKQVPRVLGS